MMINGYSEVVKEVCTRDIMTWILSDSETAMTLFDKYRDPFF